MTPVRRLLCGGAAGITSVVCTYPLDIVRTRLSIQSASFAVLGETPLKKLPGMWATMVTMYRTEGGVVALYRGIVPTVAGVAPYVSNQCSMFGQLAGLATNAELGRPQLHDVRGRTKICHARG